MGLVFNLEENSVGAIILGDYLKLQEGDEAKTTGKLLSVPVGEAVLGRVLDPLGNPLDGKGPIVTNDYREVESPAPKSRRLTQCPIVQREVSWYKGWSVRKLSLSIQGEIK